MLGAVSDRTLNLKASQASFSLMLLLAISRSADSDPQDAEAVVALAEPFGVTCAYSNGSLRRNSPSVLVRCKGSQIAAAIARFGRLLDYHTAYICVQQ